MQDAAALHVAPIELSIMPSTGRDPTASSGPSHHDEDSSASSHLAANQGDTSHQTSEETKAAAEAKAAAYETGWSDLSPSQITAVFFALSIGQLVVALDQSMIAVAMPNIVEQLGYPEMQSWLISGYILTNGTRSRWQGIRSQDIYLIILMLQ